MYNIPAHVAKLNLAFCARRISMNSVNYAKELYGVLGVKPSSTQREIKGAYYKLSMELHPDRNKGSKEAAEKFRVLTDAYEVLGNVKSRKLYDRGALQNLYPAASEPEPPPEPEQPIDKDAKTRFYKAYAKQKSARKSPTATFSNHVYNCDEWTRAHYTASFVRERSDAEHNQKMSEYEKEGREGKEVTIFVCFLVASAALYVTNMQYNAKKLAALNYKPPSTASSVEH